MQLLRAVLRQVQRISLQLLQDLLRRQLYHASGVVELDALHHSTHVHGGVLPLPNPPVDVLQPASELSHLAGSALYDVAVLLVETELLADHLVEGGAAGQHMLDVPHQVLGLLVKEGEPALGGGTRHGGSHGVQRHLGDGVERSTNCQPRIQQGVERADVERDAQQGVHRVLALRHAPPKLVQVVLGQRVHLRDIGLLKVLVQPLPGLPLHRLGQARQVPAGLSRDGSKDLLLVVLPHVELLGI